jgi:hypothetical protein
VAPFTRVVGIARAAPFFAAYSATSVVIRLFGRRNTRRARVRIASSMPGFLAYGRALLSLSSLPVAEGGYATLVLVGAASAAGSGTARCSRC